jgi:hypothetical protein
MLQQLRLFASHGRQVQQKICHRCSLPSWRLRYFRAALGFQNSLLEQPGPNQGTEPLCCFAFKRVTQAHPGPVDSGAAPTACARRTS